MSGPRREAATDPRPLDPRLLDERARRAAQCVFDRPIVLEAGAGTGKTSTLVARVVAWCLGPGWEQAAVRIAEGAGPSDASDRDLDDRIASELLSRVAAITFTEAAAAEMASRVGDSLESLSKGELPKGSLAEALPAESLRRSRARALIGALDLLVVRTIHAWCRRLLARRPLEAGLHPRFEVDADAEVQAAVVRDVVETTLREAFLGEGGDALIELAARDIGPARVEEALAGLLAAGVSPADLEADPFAPERLRPAWEALAEELAALREAEANRLATVSTASTQALRESLAGLEARCREALAKPAARASRELAAELPSLFAEAPRRRLGDWARGRFQQREGDALGDERDELVSASRRLRASLTPLLRLDPEQNALARRALVPLLTRACDELRRRGVLGFADLLRSARDLLRSREDVLAELRRELDVLLVDEFQDTDPLQCEIVGLLALGGGSERPSLFLVGDPKQSIYGWREADLRAYDSFVERVLGEGGERHGLVVNFRSLPGILDEVERVIAPLMQRRAGLQPSFQPLLPCDERRQEAEAQSPERAEEPVVEHWLAWTWDAENDEFSKRTKVGAASTLEARALAADVAQLARTGVALREIALLFRSTTDWDRYLEAFRAAGVPYEVERDRSYYRRREIIEAAAAVRCVLDPNDHLALLSFMRSAYVGVPDAALIPLWMRGFPEAVSRLDTPRASALAESARVLDQAMQELPQDVPELGRVAGWDVSLRAALESLACLRESFERDPADRFVENLRRLLLLEATEASRYLGAYRAANLERFFQELATELCEGGDPEVLLRRLRTSVAESRDSDEARPRDAGADAVRVMTIHKAKGLDFDHVYVMQLHKGSGGGGIGPAARVEWSEGRAEIGLFDAPTPAFGALQARQSERQAAERVRELYVAMTRPRRRLVLSGAWPVQGGGNPEQASSLAALLPARQGAPPALHEEANELARRGITRLEVEGARFRFLAREELSAASSQESQAAKSQSAGVAIGSFQESAERLERARGVAEHRMLRPWTRLASQRGAGLDALGGAGDDGPDPEASESRALGHFGDRDPSASAERRQLAQVVGTAVHHVLERFDLEAPDPHAELQRWRERSHALVEGQLPSHQCELAASKLEELLDAFEQGPLLARFADLRSRVLARELPLVAPPEDEGSDDAPVGYESGVLDLVYRDEAGRVVVADYKTDRVEASSEERAQKVRRYRAQGEFYTRALAAALDLDHRPRFELWLIASGSIEEVNP